MPRFMLFGPLPDASADRKVRRSPAALCPAPVRSASIAYVDTAFRCS